MEIKRAHLGLMQFSGSYCSGAELGRGSPDATDLTKCTTNTLIRGSANADHGFYLREMLRVAFACPCRDAEPSQPEPHFNRLREQMHFFTQPWILVCTLQTRGECSCAASNLNLTLPTPSSPVSAQKDYMYATAQCHIHHLHACDLIE